MLNQTMNKIYHQLWEIIVDASDIHILYYAIKHTD